MNRNRQMQSMRMRRGVQELPERIALPVRFLPVVATSTSD
jgi:hypothetical protein